MRSDQELYRAFLAGDLRAFDRIMDRYRRDLTAFIRSYVKNDDTAEDLAQDVFVYLLTKRAQYDFKYSLKTYLFTIGRSRALNELKRKKPARLEEYHPSHENVEEYVLLREQNRQLYDAIQKLPQNQRQAVYLADLEGLSQAEVGKVLGKTRSQVKMTLYRARKNLKKTLEKEGFCYE